MLQNVGSEHIEITRRTKRLRGPFQLRFDLILLRSGGDGGETSNGGTQATQTDTHLGQCFRVARAYPRFIRDDLLEAIARNGAESITAGLLVKLNRASLVKGLLGILNQFVAAVSLRLGGKPKRYNRIQLASKTK